MKKFFALSFCLLICLTGCKESEKNSMKNQISKIDKKKLIDEANYRGLTTLEILDMTFDSTTEDQAFDILKSRGYATVALFGTDFLKNFMNDEESKKIFSNGLLKNIQDKFKESSVIFVSDSELFQKEKDKLKIKDFMFFVFDKNKKLIAFFKQYSENKEVDLIVYELNNGSYMSGNATTLTKTIFRKDLSKAFIGTKDPTSTSYIIFAPSIVGKQVNTFNKTLGSLNNSKEVRELLKMETESLKGLKGEEYRKKRKILKNSKKYKELESKIKAKAYNEYLKNLNKSSE